MERYCQLANKTTQQLYKVRTPCFDDHQFKEEELGSVGELSKIRSQFVLKCLYLARIHRPDFPWSVNKLARAVTKWTRACDKRQARWISYIHHTSEFKQCCRVETLHNNADWDGFRTLTLPEILKNQNPPQGNFVLFRKSRVCSISQLDVQETNCCFTQFNGS